MIQQFADQERGDAGRFLGTVLVAVGAVVHTGLLVLFV
jgi:hypothetical protein